MARPQLTAEEIEAFRTDACRAALDIIAEDGVSALTVRSLGARLGCSYAKPYRYFGDKHRLVDAVRAHAFDRFTEFMSGRDPESATLLPIERYVRFALDHSAAFQVMFGFNQAYVSSETRAAEDRAWEACTQPFYDALEAGEIAGDPERIAHVYWAALHGISTLALANKLTHGMNEQDVLGELTRVLSGLPAGSRAPCPTERQPKMIQLYQFATSPFTEKVRRALNYKGLAFETHEVARAEVAGGRYAHVSPTGKFPAIIDGEQPVWDSTDIIYHLERAGSGPALVPADARDAALAHAIEEWADESLYFYEMTLRLSWEHNLEAALDEFAESMPGVPRDQLKALISSSVTQLTQTQGVGRKPREQIVADVERHVHKLNDLLYGRDWLVGDALSFADLAVIGQLTALLYAEEARAALAALDGNDNITPWMQRIDAAAPR